MVIVEAEDMTLNGYIDDLDSRLTGTAIMVDPNLGMPATGTATTAFNGPSGYYNIIFTGIPENDGTPTIKLYIGTNKLLEETYPMDANYYTLSNTIDYTVDNVYITNGEIIKIEGTSNTVSGGSYARVDKVVFVNTGSVSISREERQCKMKNEKLKMQNNGMYNLSGRPVNNHSLSTGIYLILNNGIMEKRLITR